MQPEVSHEPPPPKHTGSPDEHPGLGKAEAIRKAWRRVGTEWAWFHPRGKTSETNESEPAGVQKGEERREQPLQAQTSKDSETAPPRFKIPTTIPLHHHTFAPEDV